MNGQASRSITGTPLHGGRLVRTIYVDEAGISKREPISVVIGTIVHDDLQWRPIRDRLGQLVDEFVPPEHRAGFVFHTKDIWHGNGPVFDRKIYPIERRWELLSALAKLPTDFMLPIAIGYCKRSVKRSNKFDHLMATILAMSCADKMIMDRYPDELSRVICENSNEMKRVLNTIPAMLRDSNFTGGSPVFEPIHTIIDEIQFLNKPESPILQISDVCAFIIRRYLNGFNWGHYWYVKMAGLSAPSLAKLTESQAGSACLMGYQIKTHPKFGVVISTNHELGDWRLGKNPVWVSHE